MAAAGGILDRMRRDCEAVLLEQGAVLGGIEARMVQRFTPEAADRRAMRRPAGEHQRAARTGMPPEHREHAALIVVA